MPDLPVAIEERVQTMPGVSVDDVLGRQAAGLVHSQAVGGVKKDLPAERGPHEAVLDVDDVRTGVIHRIAAIQLQSAAAE